MVTDSYSRQPSRAKRSGCTHLWPAPCCAFDPAMNAPLELFLTSSEGADLLSGLEERGLSRAQSVEAVMATAEGLPGAKATSPAELVVELAQVVATRTGLRLSIAQLLVSLVLPRLLGLAEDSVRHVRTS